MKYKLICCDLDGTLVDSHGKVSKENQRAIERWKEAGGMFAICSGRLYYAVSMLGIYYHIPCYAVCSNGAVIADMEGDRILNKISLSRGKIERVCDIGDRYQCVIGLNTIESVVFRGSDGIEDVLYHKANDIYGNATGRRMLIENTEQYRSRIKEDSIVKVSLWAPGDAEYDPLCKEIQQIPGITSTTAMARNLEITEADVTKWHGVTQLMEHYGLKKEEVICIGDSMNDYEMVKNAGLGVCMANGDPKLKEAAGFITGSNDDSGVATLIGLCLEGKLSK